jgi:hypothetical protein
MARGRPAPVHPPHGFRNGAERLFLRSGIGVRPKARMDVERVGAPRWASLAGALPLECMTHDRCGSKRGLQNLPSVHVTLLTRAILPGS